MNRLKIAILLGGILILYFISLLSFIINFDKKFIIKDKINNMVILTGSPARLTSGLDLMINNPKANILITGVAKGVKYSDIVKNSYIKEDRIDLGYNAKSTFGNAIETSLWMKKNHFNEIILVTDNWHMQRAILLFRAKISNIKISPYAINSSNFRLKDYLEFDNRTFFIYKEHMKYIASHIQVIYLWLIH